MASSVYKRYLRCEAASKDLLSAQGEALTACQAKIQLCQTKRKAIADAYASIAIPPAKTVQNDSTLFGLGVVVGGIFAAILGSR